MSLWCLISYKNDIIYRHLKKSYDYYSLANIVYLYLNLSGHLTYTDIFLNIHLVISIIEEFKSIEYTEKRSKTSKKPFFHQCNKIAIISL